MVPLLPIIVLIILIGILGVVGWVSVTVSRRLETGNTVLAFWIWAAVLFLAVATLVVILWVLVLHEEPWDPLGEYPIQTVQNEIPRGELPLAGVAATGPSAFLGDPLLVTGTKCNETDEKITVVGNLDWRIVSPVFSVFEGFEGESQLNPGCTTRTFQNEVPPEMQDSIMRLLEAGAPYVEIQIVGVETPINGPDGDGDSRFWETENIKIFLR